MTTTNNNGVYSTPPITAHITAKYIYEERRERE
jgi:hypothetical protein